MPVSRRPRHTAPRLVLDGRRYVVLSEADYLELLEAAGTGVPDAARWAAWQKDAERLGQRLRERRCEVGVGQAELARASGIRVETLNRIERGKTSPDYGTVRKLVLALSTAGKTAARQSGRKNP